MDPLKQAYYELKFENLYLRAKGATFQTFFEELMGRAYKADFMACCPWGSDGARETTAFLNLRNDFSKCMYGQGK